MKKLVIVKIGGSVLTDKTVTDRIAVQNDVVASLCTVLSQYIDTHQFILVHGAGGHIHALAKQYDFSRGMMAHPDSHTGLEILHATNQDLHAQFMAFSEQSSLPTVSVHSKDAVQQDQGSIVSIDIDPIKQAIEQEKIPVLYGEMVPDHSWEYSVCSGDTIISYLSKQLPVEQVIFLTDVDGLFTSDPHLDASAVLVPHISVSDALSRETIVLDQSHYTDVTGGLRGKIESCQDLFTNPSLQSIHITNGNQATNLSNILKDISFPHTILTK